MFRPLTMDNTHKADTRGKHLPGKVPHVGTPLYSYCPSNPQYRTKRNRLWLVVPMSLFCLTMGLAVLLSGDKGNGAGLLLAAALSVGTWL